MSDPQQEEEQPKAPCIHCREEIPAGAAVCSKCRLVQRKTWDLFGRGRFLDHRAGLPIALVAVVSSVLGGWFSFQRAKEAEAAGRAAAEARRQAEEIRKEILQILEAQKKDLSKVRDSASVLTAQQEARLEIETLYLSARNDSRGSYRRLKEISREMAPEARFRAAIAAEKVDAIRATFLPILSRSSGRPVGAYSGQVATACEAVQWTRDSQVEKRLAGLAELFQRSRSVSQEVFKAATVMAESEPSLKVADYLGYMLMARYATAIKPTIDIEELLPALGSVPRTERLCAKP